MSLKVSHRLDKECLLADVQYYATLGREKRQWRFHMASFAQIEEYAERHTRALSESHARLWKETHEKTDYPGMMVGPLEGALLRLLVRLTAARRVLEIGMFTGYSALAMAEALPEDGQLITCDVNPETTAIAKRYFAASPHAHKI